MSTPPRPMSVAQASGLMAGLILLSRILGQARDTIISIQFGQDHLTDAYRAAFSVPDLLFFLIAGGALSSAFIPTFTRYWTEGKEDEAWKVFSIIATVMGLVVLAFIIFAEAFTGALVGLVAPGLDSQTHEYTVAMSRIILPSQIGFFLGGLMFGTMNARRHYAIPGLSPNIYNVGIIFGGIFIAPLLAMPIFGLAWGALIGALVGNLVIPLWAMRRFGFKYRPSLDLKHPGVKSVFKLMLPVVLGLSLPGVYAIALRWFASFEAAGTINALEIGNRIMQAPLGIVGQAMAIAVFPALSALFVQNKAPEFLATLSKTVRTVLFVGVFISAMMFVLSEDVVRVLNEYGRFRSEDTALVAGGLRMFSIGIFAWCAHPVLMRAFFAMQDSLTPVVMGTLTSALFLFVLCPWLGSTLGYTGLPLSTSVAAIVLLGLLMAGLRRKLGRVDGARTLRLLVLSGIAAIATGGIAYFAAQLFPTTPGITSNLISLLRILLLGLGSLWLYLGIGKLLKLEEADYALSAINRKRQPKGDEGGSQ